MNDFTDTQIKMLARTLVNLNPSELLRLRNALMEEGGDGAGVGAILPDDPRPREGAAFKDWPAEYWESQA